MEKAPNVRERTHHLDGELSRPIEPARRNRLMVNSWPYDCLLSGCLRMQGYYRVASSSSSMCTSQTGLHNSTGVRSVSNDQEDIPGLKSVHAPVPMNVEFIPSWHMACGRARFGSHRDAEC